MEKQFYITEEERAKCRRVIDAFAELYEIEDEDILIVDVGRYGFVKLQCYTQSYGFEELGTYADSHNLKEKMNEMDSAGTVIVEKCITGCHMELWVTMFAECGKAVLCFSMCCEHSYP